MMSRVCTAFVPKVSVITAAAAVTIGAANDVPRLLPICATGAEM